jgi:hypothetical protein
MFFIKKVVKISTFLQTIKLMSKLSKYYDICYLFSIVVMKPKNVNLVLNCFFTIRPN